MESAKRASVGNNCVASEFFFFFLKRGEARGERGKKAEQSKKALAENAPTTPKNNKKCNLEKKVKRIFHFSFTRDRRPIYDAHFALSNTHTHTCFKRVNNNNNNAGVHNLFPVV